MGPVYPLSSEADGRGMAERGRRVAAVKGPEPGLSYFTALSRWPDKVARINRTALADSIGCSLSFLSNLLSNSGQSTATPALLAWAWKIIQASGGSEEDRDNWAAYHSDVLRYQADPTGHTLPTPPAPRQPKADYEAARATWLAREVPLARRQIEALAVDDGPRRSLFVLAVEPVEADLDEVVEVFAAIGYGCAADAVVRTADPQAARSRLAEWLDGKGPKDVVAVYVTGAAEDTPRHRLVLHTASSEPGRAFEAVSVGSLLECFTDRRSQAMVVFDLIAAEPGQVLAGTRRFDGLDGTPAIHLLWVVREAAKRLPTFASAWSDVLSRAPREARYLDLGAAANGLRATVGDGCAVGLVSSAVSGSDAFLPNPRHHLVGVEPLELEHWWEPTARAGGTPENGRWLFSGRRKLNKEITRWLASPDEPVLVLSGTPGSGKSTVLARMVAATVPDLRQLMATVPDLLRPEETPPATFRFAVTVRATRLGVDEVASRVERAVAASSGPAVVLIDSLDEADDPHRIVAEVLRPIAQRAKGTGLRLIVATRKHPVGHDPADPLAPQGDLITPLIVGGGVNIDVAEAGWLEPGDIEEYCQRLLEVPFNDVGGENPYADRPDARRVLSRSIESMARHSFLLAAHVARRHTLDRAVVDSRDPAWRAQFPQRIGDAMRQEIEAVYGVVEAARQLSLLRPLAFADGAGLVRDPAGATDLWAHLATQLDPDGRTFTDVDVDGLLGHRVATHLIARVQKNGAPAYRFHHEALAESFMPSRELRVAAHAAITQGLLDTLSAAPGRDWSRAGLYLTRALPGHARIAGLLESLVDDVGVFAHCDPDRLHEALVGANKPELSSLSRLLRPYLHRLREVPAVQRAFLLSLAARVMSRDALARDLAAAAGLPVSARHVRIRHEVLRQSLADGVRVGAVAATTGRDGVPVAFIANGEFIDVRDPESGALVESLLTELGPVVAMETYTDEDGFPMVAAASEAGVRVWDATTRALRGELGTSFARGLVAGRHHGTVYLAGWTEDMVRVWQPGSGADPLEIPFPWAAGSQPVTSVAAVSDRSGAGWLAVGGGGRVTVWDPATGRPIDEIDLAGAYNIRLHAIQPDQRSDGLLLITSGMAEMEAMVWASSGGARPWPLPEVPLCVASWSGDPGPHGARMVLGYRGGRVELWNGGPDRAPHRLQDSGLAIHAVDIGPIGSPNPAVVAVNNNGEIRVWDLHSIGTTTTLSGAAPHALAVGGQPGGKRYLVLGRTDGADLWRLDETGHDPDLVELHDNEAQRIVVSRYPGTPLFVTAGNDGRVNVFRTSTGRVLGALPIPTGYPSDVVVWAYEGTAQLAVTSASMFFLYDLAKHKLLLEKEFDAPTAMSFVHTARGGLLAIADRQRVHVLDGDTRGFSTLSVPSRDETGKDMTLAARNVATLTWTAHGASAPVLVAGAQGGRLFSWRWPAAAEPEPLAPITTGGSVVLVTRHVPDTSRALVVAGTVTGHLGIYDVVAGSRLLDLTRDGSRVTGAATANDGTLITTHVGDESHAVRRWRALAAEEMGALVRQSRAGSRYLGRPVPGITPGGRAFVVYAVDDGVELLMLDRSVETGSHRLVLPITVNDVDVLDDLVYICGGGGYLTLRITDD